MLAQSCCFFPQELCARWHALGAFYTFARNHNAIGEPDQEPYLWASVTVTLQNVLRVRFVFLRAAARNKFVSCGVC